MGLSIHNSISEMVDNIIDKLNSLTNPLVILDEFDQLSENVLPFFKTFYNKTTSGFVLVGGEHFNKRITRGVNNAKQSYCEIYSRLGAEFLPLHPTNTDTIKAICEANGIFDAAVIDGIVKDAKGDLRRVKSEVEKIHLQTKQVPLGN
jgi:DNA transposition AAA+ family ATPase